MPFDRRWIVTFSGSPPSGAGRSETFSSARGRGARSCTGGGGGSVCIASGLDRGRARCGGGRGLLPHHHTRRDLRAGADVAMRRSNLMATGKPVQKALGPVRDVDVVAVTADRAVQVHAVLVRAHRVVEELGRMGVRHLREELAHRGPACRRRRPRGPGSDTECATCLPFVVAVMRRPSCFARVIAAVSCAPKPPETEVRTRWTGSRSSTCAGFVQPRCRAPARPAGSRIGKRGRQRGGRE